MKKHFPWFNLQSGLTLGAFFALTFGYALISTPVTLILEQKGGPSLVAGVMTVTSLIALWGYKVSGKRCDEWGSSVVAIIAVPLFAISLCLLYPGWVVASWMTSGWVYAVAFVAVDALFRSMVSDEHRLQAMSAEIVLSFLGAGVATAFGGWLFSSSYHVWVSVSILAAIVSGLLVFAVVHSEVRVGFSKAYSSVRHGRCVKRGVRFHRFKGWRQNIDPQLLGIALPQLVVSVVQAVFMTYLVLDIGVASGTLVIGVAQVFNGLGAPMMAKAIKKLGDEVVIYLSLCSLTSSMLLIRLGREAAGISLGGVSCLLLLAGFLIGLALSGARLSFKNRVYDRAPEHKKGAATALSSIVPQMGMLIGYLVGALLASILGYSGIWLSLCFILLVALALVHRQRLREKRQKRRLLNRLHDLLCNLEIGKRLNALEASVAELERQNSVD